MAMNSWKQKEFGFIIIYAICFYIFIINRSLKISHDHYQQLWGLRPGWLANRLNDVSDGQWRNFRGNIPILSAVFGAFTVLATSLQKTCQLRANGMSIVWLMVSLIYLIYLHGACVLFILSIASLNFLLVKIFARTKYFPYVLWTFNVFFLICNRVYEGYSFSILGRQWAYLDNFRGTFRWHICFNFVALRMISFGCDYHWAQKDSRFDQEKHIQRCSICKSGRTCYLSLQERSLEEDKYSYIIYLCYLLYAPLYIAGPIISFNAFASQIDRPQNTYLPKDVALYGLTWAFSLCLVELITHFFYYNAFATSGLWKQLSALDVFIIGYGVLNFMWLKFLLIWRFFRFWSLLNGIEAPENMPKCINNCHNLESFWKSWHASFNKWLVRYLYIPLGGAQTKLLNVWVIFTFVAIWHDLEWKLLSWAWLTCIFFIPEILLKSAAKAFKVESTFWKFFFEELSAISGAVTITCLMIANLVGFVVGPSGINFLISGFLHKEGLPVLAGIFFTFYLGTKLMFHIRDARQKSS
ncbi:putative membrane-bound O-acyltransferase C24H6.01c isoform X1 [Chenopodium quinoa]|uniref:putative membrane-bound O-acyltransferase C24H6.01c isoform X1 n=1 Tax=Chenopodium quinoa TaxID=63459 RepID=UPI000B78E7E2|nr:putative membrane-bound O-acyltransferase C24H6.01c isoform X1 [Chenopodium quinoa]